MPRWPARASATRTICCTAPVAAPAAWPRRQRRTREAPRPGATHPLSRRDRRSTGCTFAPSTLRAPILGGHAARATRRPSARRPPARPRRANGRRLGQPACRAEASDATAQQQTYAAYRAGAGRRLSTSEDHKRARAWCAPRLWRRGANAHARAGVVGRAERRAPRSGGGPSNPRLLRSPPAAEGASAR